MPARPAASDPPVCPVSGDRRPCTIIATPPGSREPNEVYPTSLPRTTNQASATLGPQPQTVVDISAPLPSVARCVPARRRCGRRSRCIAGIRVGDGRFCPSDRGRRATQSAHTKQNCAPQQIRLACCICERQSVSRRRASAHCFLGRFLPKLRRCQKHRRFFSCGRSHPDAAGGTRSAFSPIGRSAPVRRQHEQLPVTDATFCNHVLREVTHFTQPAPENSHLHAVFVVEVNMQG